MIKHTYRISGKIVLPVIVLGLFVSACTSHDTNPPTIVGSGETDTPMTVRTDTMASDNTRVMPADTINRPMSAADTATGPVKDSASKMKMGKQGKKGKVSILPADTKPATTAMEMDKEGFYSNTEILPSYPGGQKALERFFEDNIQYPEAATESQAEGTVKLIFNVDENGKIYQPVPVGNKIGYGLEEEAIRVFNKMPKWTPGKIKGKNVKTRFTLPVKFQLN